VQGYPRSVPGRPRGHGRGVEGASITLGRGGAGLGGRRSIRGDSALERISHGNIQPLRDRRRAFSYHLTPTPNGTRITLRHERASRSRSSARHLSWLEIELWAPRRASGGNRSALRSLMPVDEHQVSASGHHRPIRLGSPAGAADASSLSLLVTCPASTPFALRSALARRSAGPSPHLSAVLAILEPDEPVEAVPVDYLTVRCSPGPLLQVIHNAAAFREPGEPAL